MSQQFKTVILTISVVSVLGIIFHSSYRRMMNTPRVCQAKLVDCTGTVVTCSFTPRKGHAFSMLMVGDSPFAGRVQIFRGTQQVTEFEIDSAHMKHCNWLQRQGISSAWILKSQISTNHQDLQGYLMPGEEHTINFLFERPPATNASIWMQWHERHEDFKRN